MDLQFVAMGLFVAIPGLVALLRPALVARWKERTDAVGSRRDPARVEPTRRRVGTTRYVGLVVLLFGLVLLGVGLAV